MLDYSVPIKDLESPPRSEHEGLDDEPILEPQLNVGGHGATQRRLRNYHVTMIGLCSGIGTGLFIGTGSAYATAGPAGLLLAYIVVGAVLYATMQSIAELATLVSTYTRCTLCSTCVYLSSPRYLPRARFLTLQAASSTQLLASRWPSAMGIATPSPLRPSAQPQLSSLVTGPTYPLQSSSPSVWS
jgi:hypothetical protein